MRTSTDALRSMKKYVAASLGDEWEVRIGDEQGAFKRPFCRVEFAAPARTMMEGARATRIAQRFAIAAYPEPQASYDESRLEAARVEHLFQTAFLQGVHTPSYRRSTQRGHPHRIPLYDYDGIALDEPALETDRTYNDFMRVEDNPVIGSLRDADEELLYVVTVDIAMWWVRSVAVPSVGMTTQTVGSEASHG